MGRVDLVFHRGVAAGLTGAAGRFCFSRLTRGGTKGVPVIVRER